MLSGLRDSIGVHPVKQGLPKTRRVYATHHHLFDAKCRDSRSYSGAGVYDHEDHGALQG